MRTTININDHLLHMAKRRAAETQRTLTSVIEDGLRRILEEKTKAGASKKLELPVSGSGGLLPGVDIDDSASLLGRMESSA